MLLAQFVIEREPLRWWELPAALKGWVQVAGGVAALALGIWCIAYFFQKPAYAGQKSKGTTQAVAALACFTLLAYVLALFRLIVQVAGTDDLAKAAEPLPDRPPLFTGPVDILIAVAGLAAILTVTFPLLRDLGTRIRWGRIVAMARLSLKEAFRSRVVWVFATMAVVFLFADWFVPYKQEDQVRNYVRVIYWSLAPLFLLTASLLGAFSIPTDVKNQSIHTIVSKPVERFEIVLGRFLGYAVLLTLGMAGLTVISLVYVLRGVTPEAAQESFTARVPIYGDRLEFEGTPNRRKGESVGREWDYRSYISGSRASSPQTPRQYAVWSFYSLPRFAADQVPYFEYTFDIFRLTKGKENKGVITNFYFTDGRLALREVQKGLENIRQEWDQAGSQLSKTERERIEERLIDKFGIYTWSQEVSDYHTQSLGGEYKERVGRLLARLFRRLQDPETSGPRRDGDEGSALPVLNVMVSVDRESAEQMLGVAHRDLYLLLAEGPFWVNFIKGIVGLWFATLLMLGLAVALSTYLSGVIAWLCALFLFGMGFFADGIRQVAEGKSVGGGLFESTVRILTRTPGAAPLDQTPGAAVIQGGDATFRFGLRLFSQVIPDVNRFDLHVYVANGFDISWVQVLFLDNLIPLLGYLLPWAVLAYYLMKFREVANPS